MEIFIFILVCLVIIGYIFYKIWSDIHEDLIDIHFEIENLKNETKEEKIKNL